MLLRSTLLALLLLLGAPGVAAGHSTTRQLDDQPAPPPAVESFLSLPQTDADPDGRARRLGYKQSYWDFAPYSEVLNDAATDGISMAAPGGPLGLAQLKAETETVGGQIALSVAEGQRRTLGPMAAKCKEIGGAAHGKCFKSLASYETLYEAVDPAYQPAAFRFWDSDAAFARERITSSPAFLKRVDDLAAVPFAQADVVRYDAITGGVALTQLIAEKRLFMVDFMPLHREGLLEAAPHAFVEVPTAVFFLTGNGDDNAPPPPPRLRASAINRANNATTAASATGQQRLMPLAIKFNVYTQHVYSPKDAHADWFLAKAAFNSLDRDVNAIYHFSLHTAVANIALSANKHLAEEHPLLHPIQMAANQNFGIVATGVEALLAEGTGLFSALLSLDGPSIKRKLFPHYTRAFNWEKNFLDADLTSRGVDHIPGFLYRDDASAIYEALYAYVTEYLAPFYKTPNDVQHDPELAAFLSPLSDSSGSNRAYLQGFPSPKEMRTPQDVARMLTQLLWIAGVQHHALNSYRILHYDLVLPSHPGKILSAPPKTKGKLTDASLMSEYIAGKNLIEHFQSVPMAAGAQAWMGGIPAMGPTISPMAWAIAAGPHASALDFFLGTQLFAFDFFPLLQAPDRLTNAYVADPQAMQAGKRLRARLLDISGRIGEREAKTKGEVPVYTLLDPSSLPFHLFI